MSKSPLSSLLLVFSRHAAGLEQTAQTNTADSSLSKKQSAKNEEHTSREPERGRCKRGPYICDHIQHEQTILKPNQTFATVSRSTFEIPFILTPDLVCHIPNDSNKVQCYNEHAQYNTTQTKHIVNAEVNCLLFCRSSDTRSRPR